MVQASVIVSGRALEPKAMAAAVRATAHTSVRAKMALHVRFMSPLLVR